MSLGMDLGVKIGDPYRFAAASGGAEALETSFSAGPVAESAGTYTAIHTFTTDMVIGETYAILWQSEVEQSTTDQSYAKLQIDGVDVGLERLSPQLDATRPDKHMMFGMHVFTATAASHELKVLGARLAAGTATYTNTRISRFVLGVDDETGTSINRQSTNATTLQTAFTLSFTPTYTGDCYVLLSFLHDLANTAILGRFEVSDGTTTIGQHALATNKISTLNSRFPALAILPVSCTSGVPVNVTLKYRSSNTGGATGLSDIQAVALRADRFDNVYTNRLTVANSGTNTTYTATATQTFTPAATKHLTLASAFIYGSTDTESGQCRLTDGGTVYGEQVREHRLNSSFPDHYCGFFAHNAETYTASSRTQSIERASETSATTTLWPGTAILTLDFNGL